MTPTIRKAMARAMQRGVDPRNTFDGFAREARVVIRNRLRYEQDREARREAKRAEWDYRTTRPIWEVEGDLA